MANAYATRIKWNLIVCLLLCNFFENVRLEQQDLWLECPCMHITERNSSNKGDVNIHLNGAANAKSDCYLIFITATNEEIIGMQFLNMNLETNSCIDIFPQLREPMIESSSTPEYIYCNSSKKQQNNITDFPFYEVLYSYGMVFGIRLRYKRASNFQANITGEYEFIKKETYKNDGRLVPGSFCDYYFFANTDNSSSHNNTNEEWKYFHSPRYPGKYPTHIKCAYKFIGSPDNRVEVHFDDLHIPKHLNRSCNTDKLVLFDSESANMDTVIDVICEAPVRRLISTGPDMLIEFNASSNITAKGFRGKFKFLRILKTEQNSSTLETTATTASPANEIKLMKTFGNQSLAIEKHSMGSYPKGLNQTSHSLNTFERKEVNARSIQTNEMVFQSFENCKQTFESKEAKNGTFAFDLQMFGTSSPVMVVSANVTHFQCRYFFNGDAKERVQIKFKDFNLPTVNGSSNECQPSSSVQVLTQARGKYEIADQICGSFIPKPILSNGPKLVLQFEGNYLPEKAASGFYGFRAEYRFIKNFGIWTGQQLNESCSFAYNSKSRKSGWFASPNFPGLYPQNLVCNYFFYGKINEKVLIRFIYFDVEGVEDCEYLTASDYVELSNFVSIDRKFSKICGKREKFEVRSDGRFFRVTFYSNDRFDKTGFRAFYEFEDENDLPENASMQSYVPDKAVLPCAAIRNQLLIILIFKISFNALRF